MYQTTKKLFAVLLAALMLLGFASCTTSPGGSSTEPTEQPSQVSSAQEETTPQSEQLPTKGEYELAADIDHGAILHAWCWSFNTIKENMENIARAGYTAIQTSPVNACKPGEDGGMQLQDKDGSANKGKWYYHYQPTDYTIGNYQLGTKEEFEAMCAEADKYGVSIIVDAVVNHMTSDMNAVSDNIFDLTDSPFHSFGSISNYGDREQVTQGNLLALHDLNTQDEEVQQYILNYLKECVQAGADGFRYDAAKHIELPDDDPAYASDFWSVILDNGAVFQYGEVLQGGSDRIADYAEIMHVTSPTYGQQVRNAVLNKSLKVLNWSNYAVNEVEENRLVTWVESHDNYCNDGSWSMLNEQDVKWAWALIAARSGGTPLFFSRPDGASIDDQWGNNQIGARGSELFMDPDVAAVNQFRNHMAGLSETLSNPMDSREAVMIERGDKGAVIVNVGDEPLALKSVPSVLADGTYEDKVSGAKFTVKDQRIEGTVKAGQIVVLY